MHADHIQLKSLEEMEHVIRLHMWWKLLAEKIAF